jgi:hypothetical protein
MGPAAIAWAGLAVSAAGTAYSIQQQQRATSAARRAQKAQERLAAAQRQREVQRSARAARAQRAAVVARGEAMGVGQSSGVSGAVSSIGSQFASGVGAQGRQAAIGGQISSAMQDRAGALGRAAIGGAVANLGGTVFDMADGVQSLEGAFRPNRAAVGQSMKIAQAAGSPAAVRSLQRYGG